MWCIVFFKQKTAYEMRMSDWSSDVCSSDLLALALTNFRRLLRNWNVREYSNPQPTLPANVARNRAASRIDLACRDTFRFQGLYATRAEALSRLRRRVVVGKSVSESVDFGGCRHMKKNTVVSI